MFPTLPDSLEYLYFEKSQIEKLPERLPANLRYLSCSETKISEFPVDLPIGIIHIDALTIAPTSLPDKIYGICWFAVSDKNLPVKRTAADIAMWSRDWYKRVKEGERLEVEKSRERTIQRTKEIKERLMATTWHPDRVLDWCDPLAFTYEDLCAV
jgi:Leucine-rich repeat (LRR) protein